MKTLMFCTMSVSLVCTLVMGAQENKVEAPSPVLDLNGSIQIQVQKALWDNKSHVNLDEFWGRANFGATFKSEKLLSALNIRAFPEGWGYEPLTGLTIKDSTDTISLAAAKTQIAKFQIEQAWVKYTWKYIDMRVGRFYTTTSKTFDIGNLLDQNPGTSFQGKAAYHNALETVLKTGPISTSILLGAMDKSLDYGYLRAMLTATFLKKTLVFNAGYRSNIFDRIKDGNAEIYNRFFFSGEYEIIKGLIPFFELGILDNTKGVIQKNVTKDNVVPVVIGTTIPAGKILNSIVAGIEILGDRVIAGKDVPVLWELYIDKKFNSYARFQLGLFADPSGNAGNVRLGLRYTGALK
jgi:hypothetical protein